MAKPIVSKNSNRKIKELKISELLYLATVICQALDDNDLKCAHKVKEKFRDSYLKLYKKGKNHA